MALLAEIKDIFGDTITVSVDEESREVAITINDSDVPTNVYGDNDAVVTLDADATTNLTAALLAAALIINDLGNHTGEVIS